MNKVATIALLLLLGTFLASAAGGAEKKEVYTATPDKSGVQKIEMTAGSFYFKPNVIIVKVNKPVEIVIKKEPGISTHSFILHAPEADIDVDEDVETEAKTIRFTPTKTGAYPFYCENGLIEQHRAKGMEGVLEVKE